MSPLGLKSTVYHGDLFLGEAEVFLSENSSFHFPNSEIRINHLSQPSERCPPLSVLHTVSPFSVRCKLEAKSASEQSPLARLHFSCFADLKTAVVLIGDEELHLVAMQSKVEKFPCFWCCPAPIGLYASCLGMLNLRCLSIVFDLDETLIVANTMKSFEDRIEFLQRRIAFEMDALRAGGMKAELKRYWDDKALLKQYLENDQVVDNGQLVKTQFEEVPPLSTNQDCVVRPVIRLPDRNIVLTRINPEIRDTSVLVRLRPAWDDLRSYLTAKGRKRFEVYVCTMAERDYALEMWRLLDPEAHLISSKQLLDRVVCVKPGSRKSLLSVFKDCICHSKMAMVIDDRLNVWEDNDQPRVHVVPAFAPYYAPQAEMANAVPVLCVARNVACNVRGGFFKEFDENLLRRIFEIRYEDELKDLPSAPDVSHYLMSEEPSGVLIPIPEGMTGAEVERRLNRPDQKLGMVDHGASFVANNPDLRSEPSQQPMPASSNFVPPLMPRPAIALQRPGLLGAAPKDGEIPQPEFERRHLILQQSHDIRNHGSIDVSKPLTHISAAPTQRHGGWLVAEEDPGAKHLNKQSLGVIHHFDALPPEKNRTHFTQPHYTVESLIPRERPRNISTVKPEEAYLGEERRRKNHVPSTSSSFSDDEVSRASVSNGEAGTPSIQPSNVSVGVLQEIGRRCSSKVEFTTAINTSMDLQFFVEVFFTGEKIGVGMGRTRKEAQLQAADNALKNLADKYVAYTESDTVAGIDGDRDKLSHESDNGFLRYIVSPGLDELPGKEAFPSTSTSEQMEHSENSNRLSAIVAGIEELCMTEGLNPVFQDQPPISTSLSKGEHYFQVEIAGQIVGKGTGFSKEEAKLQAAEAALESLKAKVNQPAQKRLSSPRLLQSVPAKRAKDEVSRGSQGVSPS